MSSLDAGPARYTVEDRYRVLLDVGRVLAGTLSTEDLYAAIYRETVRVLPASGFYVSLYDQANDLATVVFYADRNEIKRVNVTYAGSESTVISQRRPHLITDRLTDRSLFLLGEVDTDVTRSAVSAPLLREDRVLGAISAQSYESDAYTAEDLDLLQGIADISAVAIDNALHVAELERRHREAEQSEEIGRALTSSLDSKEVLGKVISAANEILDVDGASVWLFDDGTHVGRVAESGGEVPLPVGLSWDMTDELADRLIVERRPFIVDDLTTSGLVPPHLRSHLSTGSWVGAPLITGGQVTGVLTVGSRHPRRFDNEDTAVLQRLANQASVALANARLHSDLQALTLTDSLTGIPNRRHLQIHLDREVAAARRGRSLVVVVFDVDDFKHFNDTLGHLVGDELLKAFARVLDSENRAMNLVARYGGDEFVSVLSDSTTDGAILYSRRVREKVAGDEVLACYGITVSCGLAEFDRVSMKSTEDIIQAADADMYRSKAARTRSRGRSRSS